MRKKWLDSAFWGASISQGAHFATWQWNGGESLDPIIFFGGPALICLIYNMQGLEIAAPQALLIGAVFGCIAMMFGIAVETVFTEFGFLPSVCATLFFGALLGILAWGLWSLPFRKSVEQKSD